MIVTTSANEHPKKQPAPENTSVSCTLLVNDNYLQAAHNLPTKKVTLCLSFLACGLNMFIA